MIQKTYHIIDSSDEKLAETLKKAASLPEYESAAQILLIIMEQESDGAVIARHTEAAGNILPKADIVGLTHYDDLVSLINGKKNTVLTLMFFERPAFSVEKVEMASLSDAQAGEKLNERLRGINEPKGVWLFAAEQMRNICNIFAQAEKGLTHIPFFGANAALTGSSSAGPFGYVFDRYGVYTDTLLAVCFFGKQLHIKVSYNYGWTPVGKTMTVTDTIGDFCVTKIDGEPAAEVYLKYLGLDYKNGTISIPNICEFPFILEKNGLNIGRVPFESCKDGILHFRAAVNKGSKIRFSYGSQYLILTETYNDSVEFGKFSPQGMMLIVCGNRLFFLKNDEKKEINYYRHISGELAYLHGNSEIYRSGGKGGELHGALLSVGIREGEQDRSFLQRETAPDFNEIVDGAKLIPLEYRVMNFMHAVTNDLEQMTREAKAASEAKSLFLARMSHEIRTPINAVLGMDEMILRESTEEAVLSYANDIHNSGRTLLNLINDILDFSKIESGKMEIVPTEYPLSELILSQITMISSRARDKGLALRIKADPSLPSRLVGDDVRIKQIVTNILTNAVKYTEKGSVELRVSGKPADGGIVLRFEIEDTGIGIKPEDLPKLTESFERIEERRNRGIEGTGLGMSITVQLLSLMGSTLEVHSTYGEGSLFAFDLFQPVADASPLGDISADDTVSGSERYERTFTAPDARILAVDDNELNLKVFVGLLRPTGVNVTTASSGAQCLALTKKEHFDLIFLDHMMPGLDGIETLREMKRYISANPEAPCAGVPVYALTANAVSGAKEMYLNAGFDGFLSKPIDPAALEDIIKRSLPEGLVRAAGELPEKPAENRPEAGIPEITGLDKRYARLNLPDEAMLKSALADFCALMPAKLKKLAETFRDIESPEALDAYRIDVHAMKSSAATVGLMQLSALAKLLEQYAINGDTARIALLHPLFAEEWEAARQSITNALMPDSEDGSDKEDGKALLPELLGILKLNLEDMDIDAIDRTLSRIFSYSYGKDTSAALESLRQAALALDEDAAGLIIDDILTGVDR